MTASFVQKELAMPEPTEAVEYVDRELLCITCNEPFVFEAGEQKFFAEKGLTNEPRHCKPCRKKRRDAVAPREKETRQSPKLLADHRRK